MDNICQTCSKDRFPNSSWVLSPKITEMIGYTRGALDKKRERGIFHENVHWRKAPDGRIYYNWREIEIWGGSRYE